MDRELAEKAANFLSNYDGLSALNEEEFILYEKIEELLENPEYSEIINGLMRALSHEKEAILNSMDQDETLGVNIDPPKVKKYQRINVDKWAQKDGFINALELGLISFVSFGLLVLISYLIF